MSKPKRRHEPIASPPSDAAAWLALVVLAVATWAIYGRALAAPFIFDDQYSLLQNRSITSLWPLIGDGDGRGPLNPPRESPTAARPLANLTFALNYHFVRLDPRGYRVVNLLIHLVNGMLLWAIVRRTLRLPRFGGTFDRSAGWMALAAALLWTVHPLVTETVVYITQRTELLVACFYLLTLYSSLRYWSADSIQTRRIWLALTCIACLAGATSKEVFATAPLVVLLFEWTFLGGTPREIARRSWPLYVTLATSWLVLAAMQLNSPRSESAGFSLGVSLVDWWTTQAEIFLMYLKLAVWPSPLVIHYEWPGLETLSSGWPAVLVVAFLGAATLALVWQRRASGYLAACVFAVLAPTHLIPIITEIAAERRMYLPLAALVTLALVGGYYLATRIASKESARKLSLFAFAALVLAYGAVSFQRVGDYQDDVLLWRQVVGLQPHNHVAHTNLAGALAARRESAAAIAQYREALRLKPEFTEGRYSFGMALAATGQLDEAIAELRRVVEEMPEAYRIRNNLGVVLFSAGRLPEAIAEFEKTLELQPDFTEARDNLNRARAASVLPRKAE